jgi:hypothetical protein
MTEKEILQQQESNGQTAFYLMAVGMLYHAYGCGAFALSRATWIMGSVLLITF